MGRQLIVSITTGQVKLTKGDRQEWPPIARAALDAIIQLAPTAEEAEQEMSKGTKEEDANASATEMEGDSNEDDDIAPKETPGTKPTHPFPATDNPTKFVEREQCTNVVKVVAVLTDGLAHHPELGHALD